MGINNMNSDDILDGLSEKVGKDKKYLKGLFNKELELLNEQFGTSLTKDKLDMLSLIRVGKKYDIDKLGIEEIIRAISDMNKLFDMDDEDEEKIEKIKEEVIMEENDRSALKDFMEAIPEPVVSEEYERVPSLIIELGATYYLKMIDLINPPHEHEFDGKYGPYTKWAFKIQLVKVSDEDLYDNVYERGFFKDKPAYVDGANYTLWLDDKARRYFGAFWTKLTPDGMYDDRIFTFKQTRKKYNIFKFALPKK